MAIVETFYCFCYFQAAAANIMKIPIIATEQVSKYNFLFAFQCFFFYWEIDVAKFVNVLSFDELQVHEDKFKN